MFTWKLNKRVKKTLIDKDSTNQSIKHKKVSGDAHSKHKMLINIQLIFHFVESEWEMRYAARRDYQQNDRALDAART